MLIFSSLRGRGQSVEFLHSLSNQRSQTVGRWMLVTLNSILGNMKVFIQAYLWGLYLPNNYNNGWTAVEKRETWAQRGGKNNLTSRKGVGWSQKDFNIGWFVCLLEILANSWQGFLLGSQITQRWDSNGQPRSWCVHLPDNTQDGVLIAGYIHISFYTVQVDSPVAYGTSEFLLILQLASPLQYTGSWKGWC